MSDFRESTAVVIGINEYGNGVTPLNTAAKDARRLGQILQDQHGYTVKLLIDKEATGDRIIRLFSDELTPGPDDRVLFYFAGHGIALDGDDGPNGYLLPYDARNGDPETYIQMRWLSDAIGNLECRHLLVILDSCFGGAFRWSATTRGERRKQPLNRERYERFLKDPAWQVITSASHNQEALDSLRSNRFGTRGEQNGHSPFALALFEALIATSDNATPQQQALLTALAADGVITATELYLYLEEVLQSETIAVGSRQTPRLWPLKKHDNGEFIFHVPGHELNLPPAPPLNYENNPYRGLKSFDKKHASLFFGRDAEIDELRAKVEEQALTVVLGASGTGKSSLVKAGLLPKLENDVSGSWELLPVVRPGSDPLAALARAVAGEQRDANVSKSGAQVKTRVASVEQIVRSLNDRISQRPGKILLLVIDQFEELVTMTKSAEDREAFFDLMLQIMEMQSGRIRIVVTLRTDFEPQFSGTKLREQWLVGRFIVPPMSRDGLRQVIEEPASIRVVYFKPHGLVERLVDEVANTPGGLPLLSFALSEMYIRYVNRKSDDRCLTDEDYRALGGVIGSLRSRANEEYESLDQSHRDSMRRLMLRMVTVEGVTIARQRIRKSELNYTDDRETERVTEVVNRLTDARLVVVGQEDDGESFVEPAHDALVRAWDKLTEWIHAEDGRQDNLRFQKTMAVAASEWDRTENASAKTGLLWRDAARGGLLNQLVGAEEDRLPAKSLSAWQRVRGTWRRFYRSGRRVGADDGSTWMNDRELAFARRSIRRRRNIRIGLGILSALVVTLGVVATNFGFDAKRQANEANRQRDSAVLEALGSLVRIELERDQVANAMQIARDMYRRYPDHETARTAVLAVGGHPSQVLTWYFEGEGTQAALIKGGEVLVAKTGTQLSARHWLGAKLFSGSYVSTVAVSTSGKLLISKWAGVGGLFADVRGCGGEILTYMAHSLTEPNEGSRFNNFEPFFLPDDQSYLVYKCGYLQLSNRTDSSKYVEPMADTGQRARPHSGLTFTLDGSNLLLGLQSETRIYKIKEIIHAQESHVESVLTGIRIEGGTPTLSPAGTHVATSACLDFLTAKTIECPRLRRLDLFGIVPDNNESQSTSDDSASSSDSPKKIRRRVNVWNLDGSHVFSMFGEHVIWSPDGSILTVGDSTRTFLRNLHDGTLIIIDGSNARFSPGGHLIMTDVGDEKSSVWNLGGQRLVELDGRSGGFGQSEEIAMTVVNNNEIRVWDVRRVPSKTKTALPPWLDRRTVPDDKLSSTAPSWSLGDWDRDPVASPDGSAIVFLSVMSTGGESAWSAILQSSEAVSCGGKNQMSSIRFSPRSDRFVVSCTNELAVVDTSSNVLQKWVFVSDAGGAAFSDDGTRVFRSREDRMLDVLRVEDSDYQQTLGPHDSRVSAATVSTNGTIATATETGSIYLWDKTGKLVQSYPQRGYAITGLRFSESGTMLAALTDAGGLINIPITPEEVLSRYSWIPDGTEAAQEKLPGQ